jgi:hypothetical protein
MHEERGHLLAPQTILPVQFLRLTHGDRAWSGEQCLMAAMLEDAIASYLKPRAARTSQARHVARQARRWLRGDDRAWVFSFLRVCEALDLDPSAIRRFVRSHRGGEMPVQPGDAVLRSEPTPCDGGGRTPARRVAHEVAGYRRAARWPHR